LGRKVKKSGKIEEEERGKVNKGWRGNREAEGKGCKGARGKASWVEAASICGAGEGMGTWEGG